MNAIARDVPPTLCSWIQSFVRMTRVRSFGLSAEPCFFPQRVTVHQHPVAHYLVDVAKIADFLLGVAVDQQEIGLLADLDRAGALIGLNIPRRSDRRGCERLGGC